MSLSTRLNLIPRARWEYGFADIANAVVAAFQSVPSRGRSLESMFNRPVLYTISGRASLFAILRSLDLAPGSGIGVPLFCCPVVFDAIRRAGMRPVFLDTSRDTATVSPDDIARKISRLSAIIVVHMFGHPADMEAIAAAAGEVPVIEDCAHALGSRYKDRPVGLFGVASFFSFRSGKCISAGEGGAIVSTDPTLFEKITAIVNNFDSMPPLSEIINCLATLVKTALYQRPLYGLVGFPLGRRIDAAFNLSGKSGFAAKKIPSSSLSIIDRRLPSLNERIARQRAHAKLFLEHIRNRAVQVPGEKPHCRCNWFQFAIRLRSAEERRRLAEYLSHCGIDSARYLDGIAQSARPSFGYAGDCPAAELLSQTVLTIPNHEWLSVDKILYIAETINKWIF
jgi:dTDP-4-amino-4,6-dideoxygalactose transaminase